MHFNVLLLSTIVCLPLTTSEPPDLLGNPVPVTVAPPLISKVVIYKDVQNLPTDAVKALEAFNAAEAKAKAAYDRQLEAERTKLQKALESAKVAATKAGNLEGAIATKAVLERLAALDLEADIEALVSGKWIYSAVRPDGTRMSQSIAFNADGKILLPRGWGEKSYQIVNGKLIFYKENKSIWVTFVKTDTGWEQEPGTISGNGYVYKLKPVQP